VLPQTLHPYVYALNNPVNLTDPSGEYVESPWDLFVLFVDALIYFVDAINPALDDCTRAELLGIDLAALGADAAALLLPGPGGGGLALRIFGQGARVLAHGGARAGVRIIQVGVRGAQVGVHASAMTKGGGSGFVKGSSGGSGGNEDVPRNLRRLKDSEVRKLGLHLEKQKWELPGDTALYLDDATKNVYYRVNEKGAPFEFMVNLKDVRKGK
jgi:hypothetical protein